MNTYNDAYQRLIYHGFEQQYNEYFSEQGVVWFTNKTQNVILEYCDKGINTHEINATCLNIRDTLLELGSNVWNSYYLLCSSPKEFDDELVYGIEHDPVAMRKFVIRSPYDLRRIPFLDDNIEGEQSLLTLQPDLGGEKDKVIRTLIDYIVENKGDEVRFNQKMIQYAVDVLMAAPRKGAQ